MKRLIGLQKARLGEVWEASRGNARVLIATTLFNWTLYYAFVPTYLPLYWVARGLPTSWVGYLSSASAFTALVGSLFSGVLARRVRNMMVLVAWSDLVAFIIPPLIYEYATQPWLFWVAAFCSGAWGANAAAFNLLLTEGIKHDDLPRLYLFRMVPQACAGLFTPLAGLLLLHVGLVPLTRGVLPACSLLVAVGSLTRLRLVRHAPLPPARSRGLGLAEYLHIPREESRPMLVLLLLWLVVQFSMPMMAAYASIYYTDAAGLSLSDSAISLLPGLGSLVSIVFTFAAAPHFKGGHTTLLWRLSFLGIGVYGLMLALAPQHNLAWLCLASVLGTAVTLVAQSLMGATAISLSSPRNRTHIIALSSVLTCLAALPAGWAASRLYAWSPRAPFLLAGTAGVLVWLVSMRFNFQAREGVQGIGGKALGTA